MKAVRAQVMEGGGDDTVYNPAFRQGGDHPEPIADLPIIIHHHPVDLSPEQRQREWKERARAIREALPRRDARTQDCFPPTGPSQHDPNSVYAEIVSEDEYPRPYTADIQGDEYYIYQGAADHSESDCLLCVSHSGLHEEEDETSFIHDPEDPQFRSDHSADTVLPTPASPRTIVQPVTDSSRPGNTDENSAIYDVGYEPEDSAEFPPGRTLGTRQFRSDHSTDTAAPTPTHHQGIPPPVPRTTSKLLPPPALPRGCRDHLQKTNFQQTHLKTVQPREPCPSDPETTDEYAPTHFTVQDEVQAHACLPSSRSETPPQTVPPESSEENPADVPQALTGRRSAKKSVLARLQVISIKFIIWTKKIKSFTTDQKDVLGQGAITYRELLNLEQQKTEIASLFTTDAFEHSSDEECEMADLTEPLKDEHLVDLSLLIATTSDLRTLGIEGLKLPESTIQSALTDNPTDIQEAAYSVLSEWWKRQEDRVAAFNDLVATLKKCGMKKSQLVAFTQKRHSTNAEAAPPARPRVVSPTNDSSHEMTDLAQTLKDVHLVKLSSLITSPLELRTLGIEGLKLPPSIIDSALSHYPGDIRMAAHSVLSEWRKKYENQSEAFWDLIAALKKYYHLEYQIIEPTPKRDSTDPEAATAVSHRNASPINDSSNQQQEQREPAQAHQQGVIGIDALWAVVNSDAQTLNDSHLLKQKQGYTEEER